MKHTKPTTKILIGLAFAFSTTSAWARTDVNAQIEKLKQNAENSEANYEQYKTNMDIVNKNIEQADLALKEVRTMKTNLVKNTQNVDKNKLALQKIEQDIGVLKTKEQEKITAEDKQIAEVRAILEKLENNKRLRQANVLAYEQKIEEIKKERADWDTQVQQLASLQKQLEEKEKKAADEKSSWSAKHKDYDSETKKWKAQAQNSRETYNKHKRLND
jgi:chromosome segregation ATPase